MTERALLAWLAGAMEPGEEAELRARLADDPALAATLRALELRVQGPPEPRAALGWSVPPPGLPGGRRPFTVALEASALSAAGVRPGDAFRVSLEDPGPPLRQIVLLIEDERGWRVLAPTSPEERLGLAELPRSGSRWLLDLVAPEQRGSRRWAVALPPMDLEVRWDQPDPPRWEALREALDDGLVPISAFALPG